VDIVEIQKLLPHRYPFLLIDRVDEFEPFKRLLGVKNVTINEPFFQGHFPGHPVMPGVLIIEALAQASALLAFKSEGVDPSKKVGYLMSVDQVKFRRPVVPGDRLILRIDVLRHSGSTWKTAGAAIVDGNTVSEAELLATMVDAVRPAASPE
jgi:3-hydroxyacyl-[acyl-carrier-protein] dehydratase